MRPVEADRHVLGADVWWQDVRAVSPERQDLVILDPVERARAAGFAGPVDRHRYRVAHLLLRRVLAVYADAPPGALEFQRQPCFRCGGAHGRPALRGPGPQFSLSHSGDLVVVAVADRPVGVDVQRAAAGCVCSLTSRMGRARGPGARLLPEPARHAAILRWWVRAEAAFKIRGEGIFHPGAVPSGCRTRMLACPPGYLAAIAVPFRRRG